MMKSLQMRVMMGVVVLVALVITALLAIPETQRRAEADATATVKAQETVMAWCGTNVYNECFEPNCVVTPLSYGECEFYYLYEQDLQKTRAALVTPTPDE
jgi:hypothetical protein